METVERHIIIQLVARGMHLGTIFNVRDTTQVLALKKVKVRTPLGITMVVITY